MKRSLSALCLGTMMVIGTAATSVAGPSVNGKYHDATPGQACVQSHKFLRSLGVDPGVSVGDCVSMLAKKGFTFEFMGDTVQDNCDGIEGFVGGWPYSFYMDDSEMPPGWPRLTARNDGECVNALYAFHSMIPYLSE